jgi:GH43 family beta-xylosidase
MKAWIKHSADPFATKDENGKYYFTATAPKYDYISLRESDSLVKLDEAEEKIIWKKHEDGDMSGYIWAPEMHFIDGSWYIYFAASRSDNIWRIRPYVLKCKGDPMKDEWEELGQMQSADGDGFSFNSFSLDMTYLENGGKKYVVWAEKIGVWKGMSNLCIAELESPNKLKTKQVILSTPTYEWERVDEWVEEGPAVLKHDGKIYITYSASATGACYCMGMLTCDENDDVLDISNWKKENKAVFATDEKTAIYGPGHNSFVKDENGNDVCVFHARDFEKIEGNPLDDINRHAHLLKIEYDKSGKPVFDVKNIIKRD